MLSFQARAFCTKRLTPLGIMWVKEAQPSPIRHVVLLEYRQGRGPLGFPAFGFWAWGIGASGWGVRALRFLV